MTLFDLLKTILLLTLFTFMAPTIIEKIKTQYIPILEPRTHIGIIPIGNNVINSYPYTAELHNFFKDSSIKGIVIKIDSLGGAAGTSQTIFHEIRHLKKEFPKPIIALVENTCVSGAYLIASACDYIVAPESSIIGKIGHDFLETDHYTPIISTGASTTEEEQTLLKNLHKDAYQQLTKQIAAARKLSLTTITNWAEGKKFTGHQALNLGLINETGSLCTVIKIIKEKALIENEIEWIENKISCYGDGITPSSSLAISNLIFGN